MWILLLGAVGFVYVISQNSKAAGTPPPPPPPPQQQPGVTLPGVPGVTLPGVPGVLPGTGVTLPGMGMPTAMPGTPPPTVLGYEWLGGLDGAPTGSSTAITKPSMGSIVRAHVLHKSEIDSLIAGASSGMGGPSSAGDFGALIEMMGNVFGAMAAGAQVEARVYGYGDHFSQAFPGMPKEADDSYVVLQVTKIITPGKKSTPAIGAFVAVG